MAHLKDLMHEAADLHFATPDVAAISRAGDRRLRSRRLAAGGAGVVAAAVVAGGVLLTNGTAGDDGHVATEPHARALPPGLSWAEGSVIHTSTGPIDTGHPVHAYVRAGDDFAFTDGKGAVFSVVDGDIDRVGSIGTERPRLVSDPSGSLVAWLDPTGEGADYVALDLADGDSRSWPARPGENEFAGLVDVDGKEVVWRDEAGERTWHSETGSVRTISAAPPVGSRLLGAGSGLLAWSSDEGVRVGTSRADAVVMPNLHGGSAVFSPGGRWVSVDADQMEVRDVRTGKRVPLDVGGRDFATGYEWLDEDTIAAIAIRDVEESGETGDSSVELMICEVLQATCTAEADLGPMDAFRKKAVLSFGEALED